jgi:hypothetical protein
MQQVFRRRIRNANIDNSQYRDEVISAIELSEFNPDMCLTKCRKILERIVHQLHDELLGKPGTKPLEQLVADLGRHGKLPRKVMSLCLVVRELGNAGSHPIYDDEQLSYREAQIAILSLINILDWTIRSRSAGNSEAQPPG